jgi:ribosomal protein S18 acetylase RimI-like enzyme
MKIRIIITIVINLLIIHQHSKAFENSLKNNINSLPYIIRLIEKSDITAFKELYAKVASTSQTLARLPHEITTEYITKIVHDAITDGLGLVVELNGQLIGWMLKQRYQIETSRHIFYDGSIGIHPDYQSQGIGTKLISQFLYEVATNHKDILRVEIYAVESNKAYRLYKRLGFETEGILKNAKLYSDGRLESYYLMVWFNPNFGS